MFFNFLYLTLLYFQLLNGISAECDIFGLTTCPKAATEEKYAQNPDSYCNEVRANVDCVNLKLKECSYIETYFQAMSTLKLLQQVVVEQATNHGCENITDKIIIPGDPMLYTTTTREPEHVENKIIETVTASPFEFKVCLKKLATIDCEKLEPHVLRFLLDDTHIDTTSCSKIIDYSDCVKEKFSNECQLKFSSTVSQLKKINTACSKKISDELGNRAVQSKVDVILMFLGFISMRFLSCN